MIPLSLAAIAQAVGGVVHGDGDVVVGLEALEGGQEGCGGGAVDGVADVGSVQGDRADGVVDVVADGFAHETHASRRSAWLR